MPGDPPSGEDDLAAGFALALASLPAMGPARLLALHHLGPLADVWEIVAGGRAHEHPLLADRLGRQPSALATTWAATARRLDPCTVLQKHRAAGVDVSVLCSPGYPQALAGDPEPALVLCGRGDPAALDGPRVAIVGTRSCTRYGTDVARRLGHDLAASGVRVVSGLALGIDGAAHAGALTAEAAPPIAVVASGLDIIYPRRNLDLWRRVEAAGLVLSEAPLGVRPEAWRFPARNRLIAGLADAVVVVESAERGGSMHTVDEAIVRDVTVMAVPGPVTSPASAGTNKLLHEGRPPVRDALDVLVELGVPVRPDPARADPRPPPGAADVAVLDALGFQPATLEHLALRTGGDLGALAAALVRLVAQGWLSERGGWYERVAASP